MAAMRWGIAGDDGGKVRLRQPLGQTLLEDSVATTTSAGDDNYGARIARSGADQEARERGVRCGLGVAVQVKRCADLKIATTHALFGRAIL